MNWTGGSLQRSRRAKGNVINKQREYFAKIRNGLNSRHNASPKRLEGFHTTFIPASAGQDGLPHHVGENINQAEDRSQRWRSHSRNSQTIVSTAMPAEITTSAHDVPQTPLLDAKYQELGLGERGVGMSSSKRKQPEDANIDEEVSFLKYRRNRVLAKASWMESVPRRPARLVYPRNTCDSMVGQRRNISSRHKLPRPIRRHEQREFSNNSRQPNSPGRSNRDPWTETAGTSDASRRTDSINTRAFGVTYQSLPSQRSGSEMLFGTESRSSETSQIPRSQQLPASKLSNLSTTYRALSHSQPTLNRDAEELFNRVAAEFGNSYDLPSKNDSFNSKSRYTSDDFYLQQMEDTQDLGNNSEGGGFSTTRLVRASIPAVFAHPQPASKTSKLVNGGSFSESMEGHVGGSVPAVPASQLLDNEAWKSWITNGERRVRENDEKEEKKNSRLLMSPNGCVKLKEISSRDYISISSDTASSCGPDEDGRPPELLHPVMDTSMGCRASEFQNEQRQAYDILRPQKTPIPQSCRDGAVPLSAAKTPNYQGMFSTARWGKQKLPVEMLHSGVPAKASFLPSHDVPPVKSILHMHDKYSILPCSTQVPAMKPKDRVENQDESWLRFLSYGEELPSIPQTWTITQPQGSAQVDEPYEILPIMVDTSTSLNRNTSLIPDCGSERSDQLHDSVSSSPPDSIQAQACYTLCTKSESDTAPISTPAKGRKRHGFKKPKRYD